MARSIQFTENQARLVEAYMRANGIRSFSAAIRKIIEDYLDPQPREE